MTVNERDLAILQQLQVNIRPACKKISDALSKNGQNICERSVRNRICKMEAKGVIAGYGVNFNMKAVGLPLRRFLTIRLKSIPNYTQRGKDLREYLEKNKYIYTVSYTIGGFDYTCIAYYRSSDHAREQTSAIREQFSDLIEDFQAYDSRSIKKVSLNII